MVLVAPNETIAAHWRKMYPGIEVVLQQPMPTGSRGMIELKENRKSKRNRSLKIEKG